MVRLMPSTEVRLKKVVWKQNYDLRPQSIRVKPERGEWRIALLFQGYEFLSTRRKGADWNITIIVVIAVWW